MNNKIVILISIMINLVSYSGLSIIEIMCGRFSLFSDPKQLAKHFDLIEVEKYNKGYNISPTHNIPVIRSIDQKKELVNCHWGLIPHWARDTKLKPINAKAETLAEKPFFRSAFRKNRCLIPANGFYEWQGSKGHKQPYYFTLKDCELFAFAGLWDHWEHDNKAIDSCTIITTTANQVMVPIHDRMPVILNPENYDAWLSDGTRELLKAYKGEMIRYPVSTFVNNPDNNGKDLIQPIE